MKTSLSHNVSWKGICIMGGWRVGVDGWVRDTSHVVNEKKSSYMKLFIIENDHYPEVKLNWGGKKTIQFDVCWTFRGSHHDLEPILNDKLKSDDNDDQLMITIMMILRIMMVMMISFSSLSPPCWWTIYRWN